MNKKIRNLIMMGLVILLAQPVLAQPAITLEAFGGWLWTGSAGYNGSIKVSDVGNYGVRGGVALGPGIVEFEWNHMAPTLQWFDDALGNTSSEDAIINYYMLGLVKEIKEGSLVPYGLLNLGVMNMQGKTISFSENFFTVGLGGGAKIFLTDNIGIRLQARLLLPMQFAGLGIGCGGGGCGGGVSTYTSTIQGDFTGGVILRIGG